MEWLKEIMRGEEWKLRNLAVKEKEVAARGNMGPRASLFVGSV